MHELMIYFQYLVVTDVRMIL